MDFTLTDRNDQMKTETYKIPANNMPSLRKKIDQINRRANKNNMAELTLVVGEAIVKKVPTSGDALNFHTYVSYPCHIEGEYPVIEGWQMVARIDHIAGKNLINISTDDDVSAWRERDPQCDHCGQKRITVKSYLIKNTENGKIMAVGGSCLKDFLPHSTEMMLRMQRFIDAAIGDLEEYAGGGYGKPYYDVENVLAMAHMCVRKHGWRPSSTPGVTTAAEVWRGLERPVRMTPAQRREWQEFYVVEDIDFAAAKEMIDHTLESDPGDNNFLILVKQLVEIGAFEGRYMNVMVAGMAGHLRWKAIKQEKELEESKFKAWPIKGGYVGTIKERREFNVILRAVFKTVGHWGTTTICKMVDDEGHILVWFSSNGGFDAEIGDTFKMKATIKDFDTFRDEEQTIVNRCLEVAA